MSRTRSVLICTYLKALAARDNDVPFYVALPSPTIDWEIESGAAIPIERRDAREVTHIEGWTEEGPRVAVRLTPARQPRSQLRLRRDPGPARHRADHRARHLPRLTRGLLELFPERGRRVARE
jgi:methylthioribose-1-phosphate isomerase